MASLGTKAAGWAQGTRPWGGASSSAGSRCARAGSVHERHCAEAATGAEETLRSRRIQTVAGEPRAHTLQVCFGGPRNGRPLKYRAVGSAGLCARSSPAGRTPSPSSPR